MRKLALWTVVGFLSVLCAHTAVTQLPAKVEDDVLKEAETDGFLVQQAHPSTKSPIKTTTVNPSFHKVENVTAQEDKIEGSAAGNELLGGENQTMTIKVFSSTTSSTTGFTSDSPTATTPQADVSNSSSIKANQSLLHGFISEDTGGFYSGSGDEEILDQNSTDFHSVTPVHSQSTSTVSHNDIRPIPSDAESDLIVPDKSAAKEIKQPRAIYVPTKEPALHKGHVTPDWIIILGFIVGVAALVMLCVAIATRDKWNGPRTARHPETQTTSGNQQREQEMTTYLLQEAPKVNGKAGEYTVIPLEDMPERC